MNIMIRKAILDELAEEARETAVIDYQGVNVDELVGAKKVSNRVSINEGESSKAMTFNAVNLLSVGLHDPEWLAGQFDDRAEDFWHQYWEEDDEETHPQIKTALEDNEEDVKDAYGKYGLGNKMRSRELLEFWAKIICDIEKDDVADDHFKRYYAKLYISLISGNHQKLGLGPLPWGDQGLADAIVIGRVPKWVYPEDPEEALEDDDHETNSASEADW